MGDTNPKQEYLVRNKKILQDFTYSFFSIGISISILQLVIYPYLARTKSINEYGAMIATIGVLTAVYQSFGGALSQTRLIKNRSYSVKGDFPFLISISCVVVAIIAIFCTVFFWRGGPKQILLNVTLAVFSTCNAYAIVVFRININYKKYFISNILIGVGYLVGVSLNFFGGPWQVIFICAQFSLFIYLLASADIIQEKFRITNNFRMSLFAFLWLLLSGALANSVQYLDKFLIFPILGGESASIFFVATFFAKSLSMIMLPIDNVLLSYISSGRIKFTRKRFIFLVIATLISCLAFSFIIYLLAIPITRLFYPMLVDAANPFFLVSNAAILMGIAYGIIGLPMLVYAPTYWQFVLNIIQLIVYFSLALFLSDRAGLMGFCFAMLISNTLRIVISFSISFFYLKSDRLTV